MLRATKWILCLILVNFYETDAVSLKGQNALITQKDTLFSNDHKEEKLTKSTSVKYFPISSVEKFDSLDESAPQTRLSFLVDVSKKTEDQSSRTPISSNKGGHSDRIKNRVSPTVDQSQHLKTRDGIFRPDFASWAQTPSPSPSSGPQLDRFRLPLARRNDPQADDSLLLPPLGEDETRVQYFKDPDGKVYSVDPNGDIIPAPDEVVNILKDQPPGRAWVKTKRTRKMVPTGNSWTPNQQESNPPDQDPFESWFRNSEFSKPPGLPSKNPNSPPGGPATPLRSPPGSPLGYSSGSPLRDPPGSPLRSPPGSPFRNPPDSPFREPPGSPQRDPPSLPSWNSASSFFRDPPASPSRNSPMKVSGTPSKYEQSFSAKGGSPSTPKGSGFTEEYEEEGEESGGGGGGEDDEDDEDDKDDKDDEEPAPISASANKKSGGSKTGGSKAGGKQKGGMSWSKSSSSSWSSRKKSGSGSSSRKAKPQLIAIKRVRTMRVGAKWAKKANSSRRSASASKSARRGHARSRASSASVSAHAHGSARRRGRGKSRGK